MRDPQKILQHALAGVAALFRMELDREDIFFLGHGDKFIPV